MIYRTEHPNPQFFRESWQTLCGEWDFEIDNDLTGEARLLPSLGVKGRKINVPFCPESSLSGINNTDFMKCVWYGRTITLPEDRRNKRFLLHIGACDYRTDVYVNGCLAATHNGGYTPVCADITEISKSGDNLIVIRAFDDLTSALQASGKQSPKRDSFGCFYTRTTGIWQPVWLETVPDSYITDFVFRTDINSGTLFAAINTQNASGKTVSVKAYLDGAEVGYGETVVCGSSAVIAVKLDTLSLWCPESPTLYDAVLTLGDDVAKTYFGMRSVSFENGVTLINGKKYFQRLVLDQGFYPDGIYTAPTASALERDITNSMALGFNGARLHQKVFEPLFLYYCDKHGYLVWGESANWGLDISRREAALCFLSEWCEAVRRDINHPSIIGWCPLNETAADQDKAFVAYLASLTKTLDGTRLYIDSSGWTHQGKLADLPDCHDYEQDAEVFAKRYKDIENGIPYETAAFYGAPNPVFVSEYGGIRWNTENVGDGWGYGNAPKTEAEFIERYSSLTKTLLSNKRISAFCYTQLTDVEQEVNGLMTYDRKNKFDVSVIREINTFPAEVEKQK